MICSPDDDTNCFDYHDLSRLHTKKVNRSNERKRREAYDIPQKTISDVDYSDNLLLLNNIPVQAECLLRSQEQAAKGTTL